MFVPTAANNFGNAFANGETVTQDIADYCATAGHGTWRKDGVDQHTCPRCGESTAPAKATPAPAPAAPNAKRAPRFNPFKRATASQQEARRERLETAHGTEFKFDVNGQTLRVECLACHSSYTLNPELFVERHPNECAKSA